MNNILKLLIILVIVFLIAGLIIFQGRDKVSFKDGETSSSEKISTTKDSSDVIAKNLPVLIDLGKGTCIPCKMMLPILQELQEEYRGKAIIKIIDIRYDPEPARFYKIRLIPTQIFFDASGKEVYRHEGFMDKSSIKQKLQEIGVK
ncbi:MAG: thioredoxin domain-containing protein [Candidatus Zixiibacteriota bacterium]